MDDDEKKVLLWQLLRIPVRWDPPPPWIKFTKEQEERFNQIQTRLNTKIAQINDQKIKELSKIAGISIK